MALKNRRLARANRRSKSKRVCQHRDPVCARLAGGVRADRGTTEAARCQAYAVAFSRCACRNRLARAARGRQERRNQTQAKKENQMSPTKLNRPAPRGSHRAKPHAPEPDAPESLWSRYTKTRNWLIGVASAVVTL